jgi:hypothetical protein
MPLGCRELGNGASLHIDGVDACEDDRQPS